VSEADVVVRVDPGLAGIVRPAWVVTPDVEVHARAAALDEPLRRAAAAMRQADESADAMTAVRTMYKRVGLDPTRTRPSSEALVRRVRRGDELPRINSLVDVVNWCSLETALPYGLYDCARIRGGVTLRLGRDGEEYAGIRKDTVHVAGRLTLADEEGPFGNPTSDSARTMVTLATRRALVVIFVPASLPAGAGERAAALTRERIARYSVGGRSDSHDIQSG
jgi:DNA/RNA-binding domain of Phe-tRNA-synthetase-like protein